MDFLYPAYPPPPVVEMIYPRGLGRNDPYSYGANSHHASHESRPHEMNFHHASHESRPHHHASHESRPHEMNFHHASHESRPHHHASHESRPHEMNFHHASHESRPHHHASHESRPHEMNFHHASHESRPHGYGPGSVPNQAHHVLDYLSRKPAVRVYAKADTNHSLTIHDGKVTLARTDPNDPYQQWVKDEKYSTRVKDEQGFPCFSLVNKATGQAMKHSVGAAHPVQLIPYVPDKLDESILWTLSLDTGEGYRTIRMVNNICLNVDVFKDHNNSVHDGTTIGLWEWIKGDNQQWKIVPY